MFPSKGCLILPLKPGRGTLISMVNLQLDAQQSRPNLDHYSIPGSPPSSASKPGHPASAMSPGSRPDEPEEIGVTGLSLGFGTPKSCPFGFPLQPPTMGTPKKRPHSCRGILRFALLMVASRETTLTETLNPQHAITSCPLTPNQRTPIGHSAQLI